MTMPGLIRIAKWLAIPAGLAAYVTVSGMNGWCPICTAIVTRIRGGPESAAPNPSTPVTFTAHDLTGEPRVIAGGGGAPMLIDIWGTRCPPCLEQRAILASLATEHRDLRIVSLATDLDPRAVQRTITAHPGAGDELLADAQALSSLAPAEKTDTASATLELPTLIFVDAQGVIRARRSGLQSLDTLRADLTSLR